MWTIIVACIASFTACQPHDAAKMPGPFMTRQACELAAVKVAGQWDTGAGAYSFRCERTS